MNLSRSQLARMISYKTYENGVTKLLTSDVAKILLLTKKTGTLNSLMRDVEYNWAELGYIDVIARSAYPLDIQTKNDIKNLVKIHYPQVKQIKIIEQPDLEVLAGVILELPDKQLDLTVATKITEFKNFAALNKKG
ncbi:MAG TPA: F0F1 ATP synthase subunit delta [Candidatus Saccharimonadales bacterium]|nr:F0F1 ATP synthase subunit delta [Candidatus Saccharimonadales bacterium]